MLILRNEAIDSSLTVGLALKPLKRAYVGQAERTAVHRPRRDLYLTVGAAPEKKDKRRAEHPTCH